MRKYKINKKDRKMWLDALESDKYQQVDGVLKSLYKESYCYLGLFGKLKGIDGDILEDYGMPFELPKEKRSLFPTCLLGSSDQGKSFAKKLADMNDDGKSFKEIAKYIRKNTVGV